ncbi:aldo/keto reductase [Candidatus Bathyarchaeota archaeon]|nr:MAG: aldo/keto reductase [Candidatus Bathyarchaeota archaeon]
MEYKELAGGFRIPVLGLGTWRMGWRQTADTSRDGEEIAAIRAAIDLGLTHIDTAEYYGAGHAEELVGEAIQPYDRRSLFITTKVWRTHLRYDDLISSIKASLKRLAVDYVDLYLVHWPNPEVPLQETMRALEHCVDEGYTRFIGVSNFSASLLAEAQAGLRDHRLVADQVKYSLMEQAPRRGLLPYCEKNDVMLIAYTPLAKGRLAKPGHSVLDALAEKYGRTQAQVSLNWLISQEKVIAIPKSSRREHAKDNAGAISWRLSDEDWETLSEAFRRP